MHLLAGFEELLAGFFPCHSPLQHSLGDREETGIFLKKEPAHGDTVIYFYKVDSRQYSYRTTSYLYVPNMNRGFWWCGGALQSRDLW